VFTGSHGQSAERTGDKIAGATNCRDCPIVGLGSFGKLAFWGRKRVRCMGSYVPRVHRPVSGIITKSLEGQGVVGSNRRLAHPLAARDAEGQETGRPTGMTPLARRVMSIYSVVKDPRRGKRQG
jgi:hypothetical protein